MIIRDVIAMCAGFALDSALGDPKGWPHPVRLIGKQIELEEDFVRACVLGEAEAQAKWESRGKLGEFVRSAAVDAGWPPEGAEGQALAWPLSRAQTEKLCGVALAADVTLIAPVATWGLLRLCRRFHPLAALGVQSILCYQLIAARSLRDESMAVHDALVAGDLPAARRACAMIVGRDTDVLDEQGVARAAVETVAENASDGVVAPLLFMGLGGAPAAMFYKAANTLDSMVGYKNERYKNLGWAAAKLDDVLNLVPARVTGALMCAAAALVGEDARGAWHIFLRDRLNHTSPNSAHAEAACAGALGVQLGGANVYGGVVVEKPTIGDDARPVVAADIARANRLMQATAVLGLATAVGVGLAKAVIRR